jgi:hypothetical protein
VTVGLAWAVKVALVVKVALGDSVTVEVGVEVGVAVAGSAKNAQPLNKPPQTLSANPKHSNLMEIRIICHLS